MKKLLFHNKKLTLIVSGGIDSTTLLYEALTQTAKENIATITLLYGQKHARETIAATTICDHIGVKNQVVDVSEVSRLFPSALTSAALSIPSGHYQAATMKQTVVPNRNAFLLSIGYGYAVSNGSDYLLYGAHAGDHFIYPDCRPAFVQALNKAFRLGNKGFGNVSLTAPFITLTKSEIVAKGLRFFVPYEKTWSCYMGLNRPCLQCGTCTERTEAFMRNNVPDPLLRTDEWEKAVEHYTKSKTI